MSIDGGHSYRGSTVGRAARLHAKVTMKDMITLDRLEELLGKGEPSTAAKSLPKPIGKTPKRMFRMKEEGK